MVEGLRHFLELLLFWLARVVISFLPRGAVLGLANLGARIGYRVCGTERRVALGNVDAVFPSLSRMEKEALVRGAFRTFALAMLDLLWFGAFTRRRLERYVRFEPSFEYWMRTAPSVGVTAHLGNWEVLGLAAASRGAAAVSVAAPLENPVVGRTMNAIRTKTGQRIVEKRGAVRSLMKAIRAGSRTAIVIDQNTVPRDGGLFVDFFGLQVPISKAAASLALRTRADIVPTFCVAGSDGVYMCYSLDPLRFETAIEGKSETEVTAEIASAVEAEIRKHPAQWLWMYRRWKYIRSGGSVDGYPWYARQIREYEEVPR